MTRQSQILKNAKRFKKSSQKWILRQINDPFIERAKLEGWRSRAAFKIIEIDQKFKIFKKNKFVVDLGAAPGGWSQYAVQKVGNGNVIALDLLELDPIAGVKFLCCDFLSDDAPMKIMNELGGKKCDILISDMAANTTGERGTDHLRIVILLEEALGLAEKILSSGGCFVGKIFQGGSSDEILKKLRTNFSTVKYFKPQSSRKDSSETYLIALGFKK